MASGIRKLPELNEDQVLVIREDGRPYPSIAKAYAVSVSLVCAIKKKRIWSHI